MDILEAQKNLEWGNTADSFDKLGFLKCFMQSFGVTEVHFARTILPNIRQNPENRKREWKGDTPTERKWKLTKTEDPNPP